MEEINRMSHYTRRTFIGSIVTSATVAIAGCSSESASTNSTSNGDGSTTDSSPFGEMSFEGYDLSVELATTEGFDKVSAFGPDGEEQYSAEVTAGAGAVSFGFKGYEPGEYRIAAVNTESSNVIAETSKEIRPSLELRSLETPSPEDVSTDNPYGAPTLEIANTGFGPTTIEWTGWDSEVVRNRHSSKYVSQTSGISGMEIVGRSYPVDVPSGDTLTLESNERIIGSEYGPYLPPEDITADIEITLGTSHGEVVFERTVEFVNANSQSEYEPSEAEIVISNSTGE